MKWIVCVLLGFTLQSLVPVSDENRVNLEFNSFYFYIGVSNDFFWAKVQRLVEFQVKYPGLKWEFLLDQFTSESKLLVSKRLKTLQKQFEAGGLDMNRTIFNPNPLIVDHMKDRFPPDPREHWALLVLSWKGKFC